ncbi:MAG TPA: GlsB/YeaQ/YmgE family stress response membrane protein [Actinomycetota bacterium]|nr:GlsB/YeaQ/YmgE family stress response membrane protein [Actinomycetota bacterium]
MLGLIISAILVGLIIGALGRLVLPARQDMPIWLTILIGIVAALIGSLIASAPEDGETRGIDWIKLIIERRDL